MRKLRRKAFKDAPSEKLKRKNPRIESEDAGGVDKTATPYNPLAAQADKGVSREALFGFGRKRGEPLGKDPETKIASPHPSRDIIVIPNSQRMLDDVGPPIEDVEFCNDTKLQQVFYDLFHEPVFVAVGETKRWTRWIPKGGVVKRQRRTGREL